MERPFCNGAAVAGIRAVTRGREGDGGGGQAALISRNYLPHARREAHNLIRKRRNHPERRVEPCQFVWGPSINGVHTRGGVGLWERGLAREVA